MSVSKVLLFVGNESSTFVSHRLDLAKAARDKGYEVHAALPRGRDEDKMAISAAGITLHPLFLRRRSLNPLNECRTFLQLWALYRRLRPSIVHHVTIKPVLYGGLAARSLGIPRVIQALTGLGYVFTHDRGLGKYLRQILIPLYRLALKHRRATVIFQNADDLDMCLNMGLVAPSSAVLIRGSGVDPDRYLCVDEPPPPVVIVFPGRFLKDKGLYEFVDAARLIKKRGIDARFCLVGSVDPGNPSTVAQDVIDQWMKEGLIESWGWRSDMAAVYANAHIVCLPSYREGVPKALIEAAACGRPIVTTDAPGCRDIVQDDVNGFLVPVSQAAELSEKITLLIQDPKLRRTMGGRGRQRVIDHFTLRHVIDQTLDVYQREI